MTSGTSLEARLRQLVASEELGRHDTGERDLPMVSPRDEGSCATLLKAADTEGWRLVVLGGGSMSACYPPLYEVDLVLSTKALCGVVAYEPEDGTLTARVGTSMAELERTVQEGGHHLSPEVADPEHATLGGVVAGGRSGFDRLRHGSVRENVLGMRVALADGKLVKSGGKLVKNVTGYDLHRLFCGSHGTLGVISEVSLRLYPKPPAQCVVQATFAERTEALARVERLSESPIGPLALLVSDLPGGDGHRLELVLAGRRDVIEWETERVREVVPEATVLDPEASQARRQELREIEGQATLAFHTTPSALESTLATMTACALTADSVGSAPSFVLHPRLATGSVRFKSDTELVGLARALSESGLPARLYWPGIPPEDRLSIPAFPAPSRAARSLMERLRASLDPKGIFATGRFLS